MAPNADAASLSRTTIADAAIALADREGIAAVSMRRVGTQLQVSGMALYRHVGDREGLLNAMASRIAEHTPPVQHDSADWRETLVHLGLATWHAFARHPWLLSVVVTPERLLDLTSLDDAEHVLRALSRAGADEELAAEALLGTAGLAIGIAGIMLSGTHPGRIRYAVEDRVRAVPTDADTTGDGSATPLAERFRRRPLNVETGERTFRAALDTYVDGLAAHLNTETHARSSS